MLDIRYDEHFDETLINDVVRGVVQLQHAKEATMPSSVLDLLERLANALLVLGGAVGVHQLLPHLLLKKCTRSL